MNYIVNVFLSFFLISLTFNSYASDNNKSLLVDFEPKDISKSAIAFINMSTSPGIDTSKINVDKGDERKTTISRSSVGFVTDFSLHDTVVDAYIGAALISASLDDSFLLEREGDSGIRANINRDILALQATGGFSIPLNKSFIFKPYISLITSHFDNESYLSLGDKNLPSLLPGLYLASQTEAFSIAGTMELNYQHKWHQQTFEADLKYSATITETFDDINELLNAEGSTHMLVFNSVWSIPTSWTTNGAPWNLSTFYNYTNFLRQSRNAIGFHYYHEFGVGLDYEWNIKPMNWFFAFRHIGIKTSFLYGDDIDGISTEIYFR